MNSRTPCAASAAELAHDLGDEEYTARDLKEARLELVDAILRGPRLWEALQSWLNVEVRDYDCGLRVLAMHIQAMLHGRDEDKPAPYAERILLARSDAEMWLRRIVSDYVTDEQVQQRAAEIAAERREGA